MTEGVGPHTAAFPSFRPASPPSTLAHEKGKKRYFASLPTALQKLSPQRKAPPNSARSWSAAPPGAAFPFNPSTLSALSKGPKSGTSLCSAPHPKTPQTYLASAADTRAFWPSLLL